jgi:predicted anti-sigma-YlaC factor YlaD
MQMDCEGARIAISALLDAEEPSARRDALERHLAGCAGCRRWREDAHEVTRRIRLLPAAVPAASQGLLDTAAAATRRWTWPETATLTRIALVLVAFGQIALTVPALIFGNDHAAPIHIAHEMGSFDLALAVGFLVAAWRPSRARGMSAIVGVAALVLILTAVIDLAAGRTSPGDEAPHLLALAGWLLLRRISAFTPAPIEELDVPMPAWVARRLQRAPRERVEEEGVFERDRLIQADVESANEAGAQAPRRKTGAMR